MTAPVRRASSELRRAVMWLGLAVVGLDALAISLYHALGVARMPTIPQYVFVGVWIAATLVIVLTGLARVRAARTRARIERTPRT